MTPDELDARRYRLLRSMHWHDSAFCVVANPKEAVKLGYDCPSDERLDRILDDIAMIKCVYNGSQSGV